MRARLKDLRAEAHARDPDAGEEIAARFPEKLLTRFGPVVAGYWPLGSEIDARPLMDRLNGYGARLALPRVRGAEMDFALWSPGEPIGPGPFGLVQPTDRAVAVRPTLILAPLLGFDLSGHRLGYGKGHYDKAVAELRADGRVFVCGLAFEAQKVDNLPAEDHDQPLDWVVTPTGNLPLFLSRATDG